MSDALLNPLAGVFADGLAAALERLTGTRPAVAVDAAPGFDAAQLMLWRQPLSDPSGTVWVAAADPVWRGVASSVLRAAGVEDGDDESLRSTFLETTNQALSALARKVSELAGHEVECGAGELDQRVPSACVWFRLTFDVDTPAEVALGFDRDLIRALERWATAEANAAAAASSPLPAPLAEKTRTFDLLLEVELPVSVSFGRAQVALKDVLKLTTGSIVELNRHINEPVEVIVNNCVIARGEVVVVEGNFGVRIQQVISRQERLRTLN